MQTYRKPNTRDRQVGLSRGKKIRRVSYKKFDIVQCLVGGYRAEYMGRTIITGLLTVQRAKLSIDKLAGLVA